MSDAAEPRPSPWHQATEAVVVLNRRRQVRSANPAFEALTGAPADRLRGLACLPRSRRVAPEWQPLSRTLSPPPGVMEGRPESIRRAPPGARLGPPWWDLHFWPWSDPRGWAGCLVRVEPWGQVPLKSEGRGSNEALAQLRAGAFPDISWDWYAPEEDRPWVQRARWAAKVDLPVWISGPPGSGKAVLARLIHKASPRREQSLITLDGDRLPAHLLRQQLFGSSGMMHLPALGTLLIRHPGRMDADLQREIHDWWEGLSKPPRIVVCAAPADAEAIPEVRAAWSILAIDLPPMKERLTGLRFWIGRLEQSLRGRFPDLVPADGEWLNRLASAAWPGNFHELRSVLATLHGLADGKPATEQQLPKYLKEQLLHAEVAASAEGRASLPLTELLKTMEARLIGLALKISGGNRAEAAMILDLSKSELWRKTQPKAEE